MPGAVGRKLDSARLKWLLLLFFLALALPTGALIWQAYGQLKWEAFHQYRVLAEELSDRIDAAMIERIAAVEAHGFADYAFLTVSGDAGGNVPQRSPLARFPVAQDFPGLLGYFQVDAEGRFSTPLLPADDQAPETLGIGARELGERRALALTIQAVLADNRLIRARDARTHPVVAADPGAAPAAPGSADASVALAGSTPRARQDKDTGYSAAIAAPQPSAIPESRYSQQVFDQLGGNAADAETDAARRAPNVYGKLADLDLDRTLEKKSERLERESASDEAMGMQQRAPSNTARRPEQSMPAQSPALNEAVPAGAARLRIRTFAGEIDPWEFSLLDSGHLVLFRKVWREDERFIQGLLLDPARFLAGAIEAQFRPTLLAGMSDLVVGYRDDVLSLIGGAREAEAPRGEPLQGTLLYRNRLSAPFDALELIYTIKRLPSGPGAGVLGWITVVIALVFCGGFVALYRLANSQIQLARQQQDFVAAVSHELKTPLTSIRMYGEMLREGWVTPDRRQQYYEYIHDEAERLTRLISNILQLARISRNEPQYQRKPCGVGELMSLVESKIGNLAERAGFELRIRREPGAESLVLDIDDDCFTQIILNLVDNALKFAHDAPQKIIEIGCRESGERRVSFTVRDYGPGIPGDQIRRIFDLFYRAGSELRRETAGTGIGLAIVWQLVRAMDGTVAALNREPGAEFRVCFPVAAAD